MNDLPKPRFRGQNLTIWNHLTQRGAITQLRATTEYRILRLGARIFEIRRYLERIGSEYQVIDLNVQSGIGEYSIYILRKEIE